MSGHIKTKAKLTAVTKLAQEMGDFIRLIAIGCTASVAKRHARELVNRQEFKELMEERGGE